MMGRQGIKKIATLPPAVRAQLLRVLTSPADVRADAIRQFYERPEGRGLAEVLMDLESDELLRAEVVEVLRQAGA